MNVNAELIRNLRAQRAWSQEDLAEATGLNLRTIQRIEKSGNASLQSTRSLALVFDIEIADLDHKELQMSPCPECRSDDVYQYEKLVDTTTLGGEMLPKLASSTFSSAKVLPVVCASCGYTRFFADPEARKKLQTAKGWTHV